jgi:hypothetical protein
MTHPSLIKIKKKEMCTIHKDLHPSVYAAQAKNIC